MTLGEMLAAYLLVGMLASFLFVHFCINNKVIGQDLVIEMSTIVVIFWPLVGLYFILSFLWKSLAKVIKSKNKESS